MANKTKLTLEGHRAAVNEDDVDSILYALLRTFDYEHGIDRDKPEPLNKKVTRIEISKAVVELLETLGEDINKYYDIFPIEWDIRFN